MHFHLYCCTTMLYICQANIKRCRVECVYTHTNTHVFYVRYSDRQQQHNTRRRNKILHSRNTASRQKTKTWRGKKANVDISKPNVYTSICSANTTATVPTWRRRSKRGRAMQTSRQSHSASYISSDQLFTTDFERSMHSNAWLERNGFLNRAAHRHWTDTKAVCLPAPN